MFQVNTQGNTHNAMTTTTPHYQINHWEREREVNAKNLLKKKKIKDLQKAIIIYFERVRMYISFL